MKYRHLFFDLDHTLWDFEKNSGETLQELFHTHGLEKYCPSFEDFHSTYLSINKKLWQDYRGGHISKEHLRDSRFKLSLAAFDCHNDELASLFNEDYLRISPAKEHLFPGTHETLAALQEKYVLHLITNGFAEAQEVKLATCKLHPYFREIIISEHVGYNKPHPAIFEFALSSSGAKPEESLMIGDDWEGDILGAMQAGMDQVFFDHHKTGNRSPAPTYTIFTIPQLLDIL